MTFISKTFHNIFGTSSKKEKKEKKTHGSLPQQMESAAIPEPISNLKKKKSNDRKHEVDDLGKNIKSLSFTDRSANTECAEDNNTNHSIIKGMSKSQENDKEAVPVLSFDPKLMRPIHTNPHGLAVCDFDIHRTLGTGSFGRVHLVRYKGNGQYYAMKVLKKPKLVELRQVEHTLNERNILARLDHPFIVRLLCTFQDSFNLYMVMEYVLGGELFSVLRKAQRFPNDIAKFYAAEVILAIEYLHSFHIIYRDLKPENLLVDKDGHIKMTDFGFAKFVPDVTRTLCGTPEYLAPEIIRSKDYGKAVDWYSLGILVFEMLAGYPPFYHENHVLLYESVLEGNIKFPSHFDPKASDLIQKLCATDVTQRYGAMKGGCNDIKTHPWFSGVDWQKLYNRRIRPPYVPHVSGHGDTRYFEVYTEEKDAYGKQGHDQYEDLFKNF